MINAIFVYGETISREKIEIVDKAEQSLLDPGFKQMRVRIHGKTVHSKNELLKL